MKLFKSNNPKTEDQKLELDPSSMPNHIAIIMDGNGRWAKERFMPRFEGHRRGVETVRKIVKQSRKLGIRYLTLYTFSSENWNRPEQEINFLMGLFVEKLKEEVPELSKNGVRLRAIGNREKLEAKVVDALQECEELTVTNDKLDLVLALSYGGREEILNVVKTVGKKIQAGDLNPEEIELQDIANSLYAPDIPDPELLIRTSNEIRISNFLLWQIAYTELVFTKVYWPDFDENEYIRCIKEYQGRDRRFGGV